MHIINIENKVIAREQSERGNLIANSFNNQIAASSLKNKKFLMVPRNDKFTCGVTLIEMVIFIAIISVAFTGIILVFINTGKYSADPLVKIRTIELGQSFLEEILLKKYDDGSPVNGGCMDYTGGRCSSGYAGQTVLQADGAEVRGTFDDVDDYHNLEYCGANITAGDSSCTGSCTNLVNESGIDIATEYSGYSVCVRVSFAGNELNNVSPGTGTTVATNDAKRIDVIITDPLNSSMTFSTYKLNF